MGCPLARRGQSGSWHLIVGRLMQHLRLGWDLLVWQKHFRPKIAMEVAKLIVQVALRESGMTEGTLVLVAARWDAETARARDLEKGSVRALMGIGSLIDLTNIATERADVYLNGESFIAEEKQICRCCSALYEMGATALGRNGYARHALKWALPRWLPLPKPLSNAYYAHPHIGNGNRMLSKFRPHLFASQHRVREAEGMGEKRSVVEVLHGTRESGHSHQQEQRISGRLYQAAAGEAVGRCQEEGNNINGFSSEEKQNARQRIATIMQSLAALDRMAGAEAA